MGDKSRIEWTDATWNPITGCDKISPGCDNCYALRTAARLKAMGQPRYQNDGDPRTSGPGFKLTLQHDVLDLPRRWTRPRMIFVNSMSDLFHEDVPIEFIQEVLQVAKDTPHHTYQVLTKRSQRMARDADKLDWPPNLWMGVSIETSPYTFRIDHLRQVPASMRFVSAEPLLGDLGLLDLSGIHWLIAGGESGRGYRKMKSAWVESLRDQCKNSGVPFFFKQWGGLTPKANGRELHGETHSEYPEKVVVPG